MEVNQVDSLATLVGILLMKASCSHLGTTDPCYKVRSDHTTYTP